MCVHVLWMDLALAKLESAELCNVTLSPSTADKGSFAALLQAAPEEPLRRKPPPFLFR